MTDQLSIFDPPRQRHSETSQAAAEGIKSEAHTLRMKVLKFLQDHGPATDEEIQRGVRLEGNCERPRRVELVRDGWVKDSGIQRKTRSGRFATVWECK